MSKLSALVLVALFLGGAGMGSVLIYQFATGTLIGPEGPPGPTGTDGTDGISGPEQLSGTYEGDLSLIIIGYNN